VRVAPDRLLLALLALVAGCGERADRREGARDPANRAPGTDAESRGALSARLRAALDAGDLDGAQAALAGLVRDHAGAGEMPDGRTLSPAAMAGAVFDAAVAKARSAIEGPAPDRARAEHALDVAAQRLPEEADSRAALEAARRWVALRALGDLEKTALAPHTGARVVAVADDFDLGEMALSRALRRWSAEGAPDGLRVGLVPMFRGWVRVGIRRTRAKDRDEERRAVAARLAGTGVVLEPEPGDADAVAADLGLLGQDAAILVFDRAGRLLARLSGRNLDPALLDGAVQKAASR
jgi:hypothetical protein